MRTLRSTVRTPTTYDWVGQTLFRPVRTGAEHLPDVVHTTSTVAAVQGLIDARFVARYHSSRALLQRNHVLGGPVNFDMSCPQCDRVDWVQNVPAVMSDGTHSGYSTGVHAGFGVAPGGVVPVIGTSTSEFSHSSALARSLAWQPILPSAGPLSVLGSVLMFFPLIAFGLSTVGLTMEPLPSHPIRMMVSVLGLYLFPILLSIPVVAIFTTAFKRARRNSKVDAGRHRARGVWSHGYYCHRCGVAYWPYPTEPGIPYRVALAPSQFRWHVWNTGGYAKL
ncbi:MULTISPECIES: hypothetical protein [Nocardia]|uniref:Uncharacterized protein n=3 Tax=Nocardia TaxID=1817 RepID=U5EAC8_NOCAS|nr:MULTISPECIES: hypothetical protein [Nocardia]TLF67663.1 hypothetical protein FEK33_17260 [Nocardia asteroides NBRC 15531]UGT50780.1 hypothetical protein LT345_09650 [Nocardia asteroides]GAD83433.1 hypothetical protein NCAST_19_01350 [Nocardia asteroides NBRC 15531]